MAVEIVVALLVCKLLRPDSVHILRGKHESLWTTQMYGFEKEVLSKYDADLLSDFRSFFDTLPLAAVLRFCGSRGHRAYGGRYDRSRTEFD